MWRSAIVASVALLALGCADIEEQNQFLVRVSTINNGAPLQADVVRVEQDSDGNDILTIPEDVVVATITNRVYSQGVVTDPSSFALDFEVKRYTVTWRRVDGGPTSGPGWTLSDFDFEAATSVVIPAGGSADIGILIAPAGMKSRDPFVGGRLGAYIQTIADIDFVGSPVIDPQKEIHVQASLSVNFADFSDETR